MITAKEARELMGNYVEKGATKQFEYIPFLECDYFEDKIREHIKKGEDTVTIISGGGYEHSLRGLGFKVDVLVTLKPKENITPESGKHDVHYTISW